MKDLREIVGQGNEQHWAQGCEKCRFGLIDPPPVQTTVPLYILRSVQAGRRMLTFCTCRAGLMRLQYARREYGLIQSGKEQIPQAMGVEIDRYLNEISGGRVSA